MGWFGDFIGSLTPENVTGILNGAANIISATKAPAIYYPEGAPPTVTEPKSWSEMLSGFLATLSGEPVEEVEKPTIPWLWIGGGAVLLVIILVFLLRR